MGCTMSIKMFPGPLGEKLIFLEFPRSDTQIKDGQNTVSTYTQGEKHKKIYVFGSMIRSKDDKHYIIDNCAWVLIGEFKENELV